jgi:hypothetical protein
MEPTKVDPVPRHPTMEEFLRLPTAEKVKAYMRLAGCAAPEQATAAKGEEGKSK